MIEHTLPLFVDFSKARVELVLQVIDLGSGSVVWTATGARSGWSREALSAVGQKLMRDLLGDLSLR